MAKNIDPELIGALLVVLSHHPRGRPRREHVRVILHVDDEQGRWYVRHEWPSDGRDLGDIQRHLEFMAGLGLIKPRQESKRTTDKWEGWQPLEQWQLCSGEEFGSRVPLPDEEQRDRQGRADNGNGGNGRDDGGDGSGGGGNRGGGGDNDGGEGPADGGQGGGRGIAEVLSHPVLFSLPEAEFSNLIDGLFEGPGAP